MGEGEKSFVGFLLLGGILVLIGGCVSGSQDAKGWGVIAIVTAFIWAGKRGSAKKPSRPAAMAVTQTQAAVTLSAELMIVGGICAKTGRGFLLTFARPEGGERFRMIDVAEGDPGAVEGPPRRVVPAHQVDLSGWRCPFCADPRPWVYCERCEFKMCGGRGMGPFWQCREGCPSIGTFSQEWVLFVSGRDAGRARLTVRQRAIVLRGEG